VANLYVGHFVFLMTALEYNIARHHASKGRNMLLKQN